MLLQQFKYPKTIVSASKQALRQYNLSDAAIRHLKQPDTIKLNQALKWHEKPHHRIITRDDNDFPHQLLHYHYLPNVMFVRGNLAILNQPSLTLVGSRQPSYTGRKMAYEWSDQLSLNGFIIVSGLARGIDKCCHEGALHHNGKTVAVIGSGLHHIYPRTHTQLAELILKNNGAIISEFPLYSAPYKWNFPMRNHTMSALSLATLIVEAGIKSGSLITAYAALDQGKDVFAMPGTILNPTSKGCHKLIKEGAYLVDDYKDIIQHLSPPSSKLESRNNDLVKKTLY